MFRWQFMLQVLAVVVVVVAMGSTVDPRSGGLLSRAEPSLLLSVDGILDEQLMPIAFLMLDGPAAGQPESRGEVEVSGQSLRLESTGNASYTSALSTLGFHRTMINLYRCQGFLAKQILESYPVQPLLSKRMSTPNSSFSATMLLGNGVRNAMDSMLYDQGSTGYKQWLTKTTTLDDIYANFLASAKANSEPGNGSAPGAPSSSPRLGQEEYFDEGIITGYAIQPEQLPANGERAYYGAPYPASKSHQERLLEGETVKGSRGDFGYRRRFHHHHHAHPVFEFEEHPVEKGSLGLKDLFDIALTTLAYLSFGMFILQVIMCITMTKTDTGMMLLPTPEIEVEDEVGRRFARAIPNIVDVATPDGLREQNRLAAYVLDSMDAMLGGAGATRDACLPASLCRANRFSRTVSSIHGYWISVWSFGVSWLAGCKTTSFSSPTFALKCLSATLVGLGNGKCHKLYPCPKETLRTGRN